MLRWALSHIAILLYPKEYQTIKSSIISTTIAIDSSYKKKHKEFANLLISGEDHRFRYHIGFDILGIIRAIRNRIFYNKIEGASTITQQLVRVITNDYEKTIRRKLKEILLSTTIQNIVPKHDIPFIYLEKAYYGYNIWGLSNIMYFLRITDPITYDKCAELIASIKYPYSTNSSKINKLENRKKYLMRLSNKHKDKTILKIHYEY